MRIQCQRNPSNLGKLAVIGLLTTAVAGAQELPRPKVLIIGIDGTMPSALAVANTPNIDALIAEGAFSDRAINHPVTHSAACWTSMFTGVWGDKHGVNDPGNSFDGNHLDRYPNFMQRLEAVDTNLSTLAYLRWAPLETALDGTDTVQAFSTDAAVTQASVDLLTTGDPDVFYTILLDVDSSGHSSGWGPDVPSYVAAIETADTRVGQIMAALTARPTYAEENWLVFVLSDHGQHDSTVERSRVTFHLVWGPDAAQGTMWPSPAIVDVCATVLTHMRVPIDPAWNLDARIEGLPLPPPAFGANLIFNGDAEANSSTNGHSPDRGIAWWFDPDAVTLGGYGTTAEFPDLADPGPPDRGDNFFLGGTSTASMTQIVDVAYLADTIDTVGSDYVLSGWFGGTGAQEDNAWLEALFLDEAGSELGQAETGRVGAGERDNLTGLLERWTTGSLPTGTRRILFRLTSEAVEGNADGFADNLSFVLTPGSEQPLLFNGHAAGEDFQMLAGSRTNRSYALERSTDLETWLPIASGIAGTGFPLLFSDTNAPSSNAYYRLFITSE